MMVKRILVILAVVLGAGATVLALDEEEYWKKNCAMCHGPDGKGQTKQGKKVKVVDLTDATVQGKFTDEQMFKTIKEGVKDEKGLIRMKPAENVTDPEIKVLVSFVRTFKPK